MDKLKEIYSIYQQTPPPQYVIENLILENTLTILGAGSNQGKTLLATHIMLCLSEGKPFFNLKTKQMNVAYFDLEMTSNLFCFRLSKQTKNIPENLYYSEKIIDITKQDNGIYETDKFIAELKQKGINFLIIDSYSQLTLGAEENSNSHQNIVLEQLYKFKRAGIGLLLLHHKRKGTNENDLQALRGGSAIGAGADTILMLSKEQNIFKLCTAKDRIQPTENWINIKYKFLQNQEGIIEPVVEENNKENSTKYNIIEFLKENPNSSTNSICNFVGGKRINTLELIKNMTIEGILDQTPKEPKPRQKITYNLKNNTQEEDI